MSRRKPYRGLCFMRISVAETDLDSIRPWRDMYRLEMSCQIVHDSIHERPGWSREHLLCIAGVPVGYGSVAVGGPWTNKPAIYEVYVAPAYRLRLLELFQALVEAAGAAECEVQSNDVLAAVLIHAFAHDVNSESILFHDQQTTSIPPPAGATFRAPMEAEAPDVPAEKRKWRGVVEVAGSVAGTGGILFHYNRPYGDIYMDVTEPCRRRGIGAYLVQELKRIAYEGGHVPAARCNPENVASQRTLQKAGFVPCGHILTGSLSRRAVIG